MLVGDCRAQLDRQVRQTTVRVEHTGLDERVGWTRFEATRAAPALLESLRIRLERQRADDLAKEQPRAELGVDETGVLADPAQPGVLRVDALLDGTGIDIRPRVERLGRLLAHPVEQCRRAAPSARRDSRRPTHTGRFARHRQATSSEYGRSVLYSVPVTMTLRAPGTTWRTSARRSAVRAIQAISPA